MRIEVSHQQLQKYEKGTNRISVSRLTLIAKALSENIAYFFVDLDTSNQDQVSTQHQRMCIQVSRNFMKIESAADQNAVHNLVKSLSKNQDR